MLDITFIGNSNSGYLYLLILWCVLNISHFGGKKPKTNWKPNQVGKKHWKNSKSHRKSSYIFFRHWKWHRETDKHVNANTNWNKCHSVFGEEFSKKRGCEWKDKRQPKYGCQFGVNLLRKWSGFRLWVPCMIRHCVTETCTNRFSMWLFYWHQFSMYSQ